MNFLTGFIFGLLVAAGLLCLQEVHHEAELLRIGSECYEDAYETKVESRRVRKELNHIWYLYRTRVKEKK